MVLEIGRVNRPIRRNLKGMKFMDTALCNALLKICIDYFQKVYEDAMMQENQGYYGTPPECIIISFGFSQKNDYWKPIAKREAVFQYSSQGLKSVSLDTVPDYTENGMYHKEAYAELSYQENGIAFMMIQFGKRYARCYRYDIIKNEKNIQLINEKLIWVS